MKPNALLSDLMSRIADAGRSLGQAVQGARPDLPDLCDRLLSGRGEATGLAVAREILTQFAGLDAAGKARFFAALSERFGVDMEALSAAIERLRAEGPGAARAIHIAA